MYQAVKRYLESKKWKFQEIEGKTIIHFGVNANNGKIDCVVDVREEKNQLIFLSYSTVQAFKNKTNNIAEFISRVNYGLVIGDFELNYDTGKIRFKTSMFYDDLFDISEKLIENIIITNLFMMDTYLPGIMSVLYGSLSPIKAIAEIEGPDANLDINLN